MQKKENAKQMFSSKQAHLYTSFRAVCQVSSVVLSSRITVVIGTTLAAAAAATAVSRG